MTKDGVGCAFVFVDGVQAQSGIYHLDKHCSVYQAELMTIFHGIVAAEG